MEYVEIVDENGNYTGQACEVEEAHLNNLLHLAVIIFIINENKQILLGKRSNEERIDGGKWALIGGHVSKGESKEVAAAREIKEEIGLEIKKEDLIPIGHEEINLENHNSHVIYFYYLKKDVDIEKCILETSEVSAIKWFSISEVINLINKKTQV